MTPMQELTQANLNSEQYIRFATSLAVALGHTCRICPSDWTTAIREAKRYQP